VHSSSMQRCLGESAFTSFGTKFCPLRENTARRLWRSLVQRFVSPHSILKAVAEDKRVSRDSVVQSL